MFRNALVALLALSISGLPGTLALAGARGLDSPALQQLNQVVIAGKTQTVAPIFELRKALQKLQLSNRSDTSDLGPAARNAYAGLAHLRDGLQAVAAVMKDDDDAGEAFFTVVLSYYSFRGLLQLAMEEASNLGVSLGVGSIGDLDLVLPAKVAQVVSQFQSQQAQAAGLEVFDLSFDVRDAGNGQKRLSLNAVEASRYRTGAFMAFPTEATAKKALVFNALKLSLAKQTMLNSFLYSDERVPVSLPPGTDPAVGELQAHAEAIAHEGAYRGYVTAASLQPISDAIAGARPGFAAAARDFFRSIVTHLGHRVDIDKLAGFVSEELEAQLRAGGAAQSQAMLQGADIIADKFIQLETQQRTNAIRAALKASPVYLTEMPREQLKAAIGEAVKVAEQNLALIPIDKAFLSLDELTPQEQAFVFLELGKLVQAAYQPTMIPDATLAEFDSHRGDFDVITSFRRYDLAQKIIYAVDWLDGARHVLEQLNDATVVPAGLLPRQPDPGMTLLALKPDDDTPLWALEMIQSVGSKASTVTADADLRNLYGMVQAMPTQLIDLAVDARSRATNGVLGEIQTLHRDRETYEVFRWRSLDERMRVLGRRAQSQNARKILLDFLRMGHLADLVTAASVRDKMRAAFDKLLDRDLSGLDELIAELNKGKAYVQDQHEFLMNLFSPARQRNAFLRSKLADVNIYRNYLAVHIQDMQNTLPILFQPLRLSSTGVAQTGNPNGVQFSELVSKLKPAIAATQADVSLGRNMIDAFNDDFVRKSRNLGAQVSSPISPQNLVTAALAASRVDDPVEQRVLDCIIDGHFLGCMKDIFSDGPAGNATVADRYWPTHFNVRDVLPAYFDTGTSNAEKVRRVAVAALLTPYLRSAAEAGQNEVKVLLDPKTDHTKALVQSEAYRLLVTETGSEAGDGLSDIQKKALKWKRRWEAVKRVTMKTQDYSNTLFYETLFLDIPAEGHLLAGVYMALSSFVDFTADVGMFIDYWDTYADMKPFASSGALGKGLIAHSELEQVRREMHNMAEVIINRAPMDLWFYVSIGHDIHSAAKQFVLSRRFNGVTANINKEEFAADIQGVAKAYEDIGLDLSVKPEQFNRLYEAKARELAPKFSNGEGGAAARAEFQRWVNAKKASNSFTRKYAAVFAAMAQQQAQAQQTQQVQNQTGDNGQSQSNQNQQSQQSQQTQQTQQGQPAQQQKAQQPAQPQQQESKQDEQPAPDSSAKAVSQPNPDSSGGGGDKPTKPRKRRNRKRNRRNKPSGGKSG